MMVDGLATCIAKQKPLVIAWLSDDSAGGGYLVFKLLSLCDGVRGGQYVY